MKIRERSGRGRAGVLAAIVCAVAIPLANSRGEEGTSPFKISLQRENDRAETRVENGAATIAIHSPFGIGKATVERTGDAWPKETKLRLHLRGLEHFAATAGEVRVSANLDSTVDASRSAIGQTPAAKAPSATEDPLRVEVRSLDEQGREAKQIPPGGSFEIRLPKALFEKNPRAIELEWIDFYRG